MRRFLPAATPVTLLSLLNRPDTLVATLAGAGAGNVNSGTHVYGVSFVIGGVETEVSVLSNVVTTTGGDGQVNLTQIPIGPAGTTARKIYRSAAGLTALKLQSTIANNAATTLLDNATDASLGAAAPGFDSTGTQVFRGSYPYLTLSVEGSGNTAPVYVDEDNPLISATNYGRQISPAVANIPACIEFFGTENRGLVLAGSIWLFAASVQQIFIMGHEV